MATETGPAGATFSSPSMRARVHLLQGLAAVDELERAWARRDYWTAREYVRSARAQLAAAEADFEEAWRQTDTLETVESQPADVPPGVTAEDLAWLDPAPWSFENDTDPETVQGGELPADVADAAAGMEQYQADGR